MVLVKHVAVNPFMDHTHRKSVQDVLLTRLLDAR
jgi:hypothetical protein